MSIVIKGAKPVKVGNSFYFTIPKQYITNSMIEVDKEYKINIELNQGDDKNVNKVGPINSTTT